MSRSVRPDLTAREFEPPRNTQFSVFLDNRVGKLMELVHIFNSGLSRLVAFSVIDAADHAVVRLVTSDAYESRKLLNRYNLPFAETPILVVELSKDQTLERLCAALLGAEINIYYAYPLMVRSHGAATIALHCDNEVLASQILQRKGFILLGEDDLNQAS